MSVENKENNQEVVATVRIPKPNIPAVRIPKPNGKLEKASNNNQSPKNANELEQTMDDWIKEKKQIATDKGLKFDEAKCIDDWLEHRKRIAKGNGHQSDIDKWMDSVVSSNALISRNTPKPDELIKGVLYKGGRLMITGGAKSYKTWLLLRLAECVSEGLPWLGMETIKGKVLFINFELPEYLLEDRVKKIHNEVMPNTSPSGNLMLKTIDEVSASAKEFINLIPELALYLKKQNYVMVVIDPIYSLYDGGTDENSASDVKVLLDNLKKLANKSGAAIVYSHHHTKGGQGKKDAIDRSSGSGVFKRHPTAIIDFTELEPANDECEDFVVSYKLTAFPRKQKQGVKILQGYKVMLDSTLKLDRIKDPAKYKASFNDECILKVLSLQKYTAGDLKNAVIDDTGMSLTTFDRLWRKVKVLDGVEEDEKGLWTYTPGLYRPIPKISKASSN
jgi:hypothetical protein